MGTAVAEMVTNLLQAQPRLDKMRRAGVAEAVWTVIPGLNAQSVKPAGDRMIHATCRERAKRSFERHEDFPGSATRPNSLEISYDRVTD